MSATDIHPLSAAQERVQHQASRLADLLSQAGIAFSAGGTEAPAQLVLSDRGWLPLIMERLAHEVQALYGRAIADETFVTFEVSGSEAANSVVEYRVHIHQDAPAIVFPVIELLLTSCCKSVFGLAHDRELEPGSLAGVVCELNEIDWEHPLPVIAPATIRQWQGGTYPSQQGGR